MQKKMGSSLKYEHEKGIYYSLITDRLICGSCLQTAKDVDTIRDKENVGTILCLQEDKDMVWWNLDIVPIQERAKGALRLKPAPAVSEVMRIVEAK
eukprot:6215944-Pyramimonas_sp.AAC.4